MDLDKSCTGQPGLSGRTTTRTLLLPNESGVPFPGGYLKYEIELPPALPKWTVTSAP
jgi:hypothetical protein